MQNVCYIDEHFVKEDSKHHILSIRYSTDGLSFCIHDSTNKLLVFFHQPYTLDVQEAVTAKVKQIISSEELLNLEYKKVIILACAKEKLLIPEEVFESHRLPDVYKVCLQPQQDDLLFYKNFKTTGAYLLTTQPRHFVTFLSSRYPNLSIVNSAYPFIVNSLANIVFNIHYLFIDIHDRYFDLLLTRSSDILLFNTFTYRSVTDIIYHTLNSLVQTKVKQDDLQTSITGNLVNDPKLSETFNKYIPNVSLISYTPLSQLVKNKELNSSCFVYLLNLHKCE